MEVAVRCTAHRLSAHYTGVEPHILMPVLCTSLRSAPAPPTAPLSSRPLSPSHNLPSPSLPHPPGHPRPFLSLMFCLKVQVPAVHFGAEACSRLCRRRAHRVCAHVAARFGSSAEGLLRVACYAHTSAPRLASRACHDNGLVGTERSLPRPAVRVRRYLFSCALARLCTPATQVVSSANTRFTRVQVARPQSSEANASVLAELRPESAADRLTADGRAVGLGEGEAGGDAPVRVRVGGLPPRLTSETEDSVLLYDARRLEATLGIRQIWVCRRIRQQRPDVQP